MTAFQLTPEAGGSGDLPGRPALSANALQLSPREWIATVAGFLLLLGAYSAIRSRVAAPDVPPDYRIPYSLSERYDLYERYCALAASKSRTLLVGDSFIWGQYADREGTLAHYLNVPAGGEQFANLGLDGMHPVALSALMRYHAPGITGREVILHCNLLWFSTRETGWTEDDLFRNHPNLRPRFSPTASLHEERILHFLNWAAMDSPAWKQALMCCQSILPERLDLLGWTLEHPYDNPFALVSLPLPPPEKRPPRPGLPGQKPQEASKRRWEDLDRSIMWGEFQQTVATLRERGNRVTVLVGPTDEGELTPESRAACARLKSKMEAWCRAQGIRCIVPDPLPGGQFADFCHPTEAGYAELALRLRRAAPDLFGPPPK
jgi:hypothetical protein